MCPPFLCLGPGFGSLGGPEGPWMLHKSPKTINLAFITSNARKWIAYAKYDLETFVKYNIQHSDKYSRKRHARWWPGPSPRTAAVQGSRG